MMNLKILVFPVLVFLMTVAFGFWMSRSGRPYNALLFNIHKLAALGGVVLTILRVKSSFLVGGFSGWMTLVCGGAALSVVMYFGSGAVMSIRGEGTGLALFSHRADAVIITFCLLGLILLF